MPCAVILNAVKNLKVSVAVDGSTCLEILRCTQDDIDRHDDTIYSVILNAVKNLLKADKRQPALIACSMARRSFVALRMT